MHVSRLEAVNLGLEDKLAAAENRIEELEEELEDHDYSDEEPDSTLEEGEFVPLQEEVARDMIWQLRNKIQQWAEENSAASMMHCGGISSNKQILNKLKKYHSQNDRTTLVKNIPFSSGRITEVLVEALLTRAIFEEPFRNPVLIL
ncbi:hypothetical protein BJX70DRAFT_395719 [Aspergillus crustosus]